VKTTREKETIDQAMTTISFLIKMIYLLVSIILSLLLYIFFESDIESFFKQNKKKKETNHNILKNMMEDEALQKQLNTFWKAPNSETITDSNLSRKVAYGKELIKHTSYYLGPKGKVMQISNGMNCQNCHLEAGTKPYGNNYGSVLSTYPKYRPRSGTIEDIYKRINDCIERSLNGKPLAIESQEMQAIKSYIEYLGKDVKKGEKAKGSGIYDLPLLDRPIDPLKGKEIFLLKCQSCHQENGRGVLDESKTAYTYPPLWGINSYNNGAGLVRMSRFAGFIKYNMPQGATFTKPLLTDEEAWDLAAYVNSQSRPSKDITNDWPKINEKPFDHPFGPFADTFPEVQHKYGPYEPIKLALKNINKTNTK
jgi:thiosulfate dehydrogenase